MEVQPDLLHPDSLVEVLRFGFPLDPAAFVKKAISVGHPFDFKADLPPALRQVVCKNVRGSDYSLAKRRLQFVAKWSARAKALEEKEKQLHESLPKHVRDTLKGKRLLLWQEMIQEYDLPDKNLISDMQEGFKLSGWLPTSGAFPLQSRRPEYSLETLKLLAAGLNRVTLEKAEKRQEDALESLTWEETLAEEDSSWIWRCNEDDLDSKVVARRFGIRQGLKIRVIDDCTACGLNNTVGLTERMVIHSIDFMASLLSHAVREADPSCGPLCGRTFDLKSAYKQFAISTADRELLRLVVNVAGSKERAIFGFNSLPFGAVGSVAAFLRVSMSVWQIGVLGARLLWTSFFDDFSVVSKASLVKNAGFVVESLFSLLGLSFAREGKKAPPFSQLFRMLGLEVDLSGFEQRVVKIGHTEERKIELQHFIQQIKLDQSLDLKTAERLRGRMNFFEGHCFGRGPAQALRTLDFQARSGALCKGLSNAAVDALDTLSECISSASPLEISVRCLRTWYLFTDGECDAKAGTGGVGGILYDEDGKLVEAFGAPVPSHLMQDLLRTSANPIYELEILPVLLAYRLWYRLLANAQVVCYLDNDAARYALIRSCGSTAHAADAVREVRSLEMSCNMRVWFARVPTASNPADAPSKPPAQICL